MYSQESLEEGESEKHEILNFFNVFLECQKQITNENQYCQYYAKSVKGIISFHHFPVITTGAVCGNTKKENLF